MLNKDMKTQIILGVVIFVLCFSVTLQCRSVSKNDAITNRTNLRIDELLVELKSERDKTEEMSKKLAAYENDIAQYREAAAADDNYSKILSEQLTRAELLAGFVDVKGEGITVTLDDMNNRKDIQGVISSNATLIHDEDIRKVINELFAAGAEVVAVNDSRIISTSAVRCVGPSVLVNDTKMTPPYVIKAIGKADQLEAALKLNGGVIDSLAVWGFDIKINKFPELTIPKYSGKVSYDVAQPVITEEESKR